MKKYLFLILLFSIFMSGCARQNRINFSSSEAFFSSLNETNIIQKENNYSTSKLNNLKKKNTNDTNQKIIKIHFHSCFSIIRFNSFISN